MYVSFGGGGASHLCTKDATAIRNCATHEPKWRNPAHESSITKILSLVGLIENALKIFYNYQELKYACIEMSFHMLYGETDTSDLPFKYKLYSIFNN